MALGIASHFGLGTCRSPTRPGPSFHPITIPYLLYGQKIQNNSFRILSLLKDDRFESPESEILNIYINESQNHSKKY